MLLNRLLSKLTLLGVLRKPLFARFCVVVLGIVQYPFNRPFPSSKKSPTFKTRLSAKPLLWKWVLFASQSRIIFISMASHLASLWKWDFWNSEMAYSWFATTWQSQHNRIFSRRTYVEIYFSSQSRKMLLFLTTNMAVVTSRGNQQLRN